MGLTPSKEALLAKMNQNAESDYQAVLEKFKRQGKQPPPPPAALTPDDVEYPKCLHKGWKLKVKGPDDKHAPPPGLYVPSESILVKNKAEHDAAGDGWSDSPPKGGVKEAIETKVESVAKMFSKKEAPKKE